MIPLRAELPNTPLDFQVEIISDEQWKPTLSMLGEHDFAQTFDFHRISEAYGEGEPLAFVARNKAGQSVAMWPVLKRKIESTDLFDFTSVYGHAGPILGSQTNSSSAVEAIFGAMERYGAISLFSRMHPLFVGRLDESVRGSHLGEIVVIEVGTNPDVLNGYRGGHRREIVKARANGVEVSAEAGSAAVAEFHTIYHQAMSDLGAGQYYFFDRAYLNAMEAASDFKTLILFASLEGRRIAASMFIVTGSIMQYYLSGTVSEFRQLAPSKVIIAHAHELAVEMRLKLLVLGGGVGSGRDALFTFKRGFSQLTLPFYVTRRILNNESYRELCATRGVDVNHADFFPAYREPLRAD